MPKNLIKFPNGSLRLILSHSNFQCVKFTIYFSQCRNSRVQTRFKIELRLCRLWRSAPSGVQSKVTVWQWSFRTKVYGNESGKSNFWGFVGPVGRVRTWRRQRWRSRVPWAGNDRPGSTRACRDCGPGSSSGARATLQEQPQLASSAASGTLIRRSWDGGVLFILSEGGTGGKTARRDSKWDSYLTDEGWDFPSNSTEGNWNGNTLQYRRLDEPRTTVTQWQETRPIIDRRILIRSMLGETVS